MGNKEMVPEEDKFHGDGETSVCGDDSNKKQSTSLGIRSVKNRIQIPHKK
jgi:hypothetical protein